MQEANQRQEVDQRLIEKGIELIDLKKDQREKEMIADEAKARAKQKEQELLSLMESFGLTSVGDKFGHAGLGTIVRRERFYGRITDMELATKMFEEAGIYDQVLKLTPVKKRLNAFITELLENNKPLDGLDFHADAYISILKV